MGSQNREADNRHARETAAKHGAAVEKKKRSPRRVIYLLVLIIMALAAIGFLVMLILLDMLPKELTLGIIAVMLSLLIVTGLLFMSRRRGFRITGIITSLIFLVVFVSATAFMSSTYAMLNKVSSEREALASGGLVNVTGEPFNIYITGIDQWTKDRGYDLERSDVNMIVTVSPVTHKILLTSIPRDAYIVLHRTGTMDKLTHTGVYGVDETLTSVGEWLDLDFSYYVKMNFNACVKIVDAVGGVDVDSPKAFKSKISKYKYKKGINHLNGKQALYYARERAAFEGEDQLRVRNQLQVMEAVIQKVTTSSTLLTSYGSIMEALGDEMETNMPTSDIQKLMKMQLSDMRPWEIETQRMTGTYDMEVVASLDSSNKYSVLKVDPASKNSCLMNIARTLNPTEAELEAAEEERRAATLDKIVNGLIDKILGRGEEDENAEG